MIGAAMFAAQNNCVPSLHPFQLVWTGSVLSQHVHTFNWTLQHPAHVQN